MPTQVSLLDGALASAGTLAIQTNGTTSAITISSAQVATFVNNPIMTGLTASRAVFTDGSKGLTSNAITGTGNVVMSASPTLTGTIDGAALTLSSSLTLNGGTANGVLYLNGSKVATSGSALTFDGTSLSLTTAGAIYKVPNAGGSIFSAGGNDGVYIDGTSHYVATYANGSEQMRLTSTGLGIGTSSPSTKLTVHAGADGDVGFFRGGSTRQVQIGTSSTAGYINTDNGSAGLEIRTQGTARAYFDNSGNLGLGVTPSAWGAPTFQVGRTSVYGSGSFTAFGSNWYSDTGDKYIASDYATQYYQLNGQHVWRTAPSGTAGNAITFTQAMTLDASGNLGLGTSSPAFGSGSGLEIERAGIATLRLENSSAGNNLEIYNDSLANGINFRGYNAAPMVFWTNNTERARIDSSGRFLLNQTSNNGTALMQMISPASTNAILVQIGTNGNNAMSFLNSGGAANVGSITVNSASTAYNTSSDYRLKENIQPMTGALAFVRKQRPVTYNWKADGSEGAGYIAHWMQEDGAGNCVTGEKDAVDAEGNPQYQGIDTSFMVAPLNAAINELADIVDAQAAIIEQLKADVAELKGA